MLGLTCPIPTPGMLLSGTDLEPCLALEMTYLALEPATCLSEELPCHALP
jgi:hypothetical protein